MHQRKTRPYFDWIFKRQAAYASSGKYQASAKLIGPNLPAEGKSSYPIKPTHQLQIDFTDNPNNSTSMILLTLFDQGRWWEVLPCPDEATVDKVRRIEAENVQREQNAQSLLANMAVDLRNELINLLQSGQRVETITRYAQSSKQDLTTSRSVIALLERALAQRKGN